MKNPATAPAPKDPRKGAVHGCQRRFLAGSGTGWDQATWPTSPGTADTTTWIYQESTGLLTAKTYAANNPGPAYTYDSAGRLATRTWARHVNSQDLVTTYSYDANTGELTEIDYSDATPDVTFTYTRTGQKATVTEDPTGTTRTHTFAYTAALGEDNESIDGNLYTKRITRKYDSLGRSGGFQIGISGTPDANYDVTYSYGSDGRFGGLETTVPSSFSATYGYVTNSNLVGTVTFPNSIVTTKHYEDHRDLLDWIENKVGSTSVSKYDYGPYNDAAGRRTGADWSGSAFSLGQGQGNDSIAYGYNSRSEVTTAIATTRMAYDFDYSYDSIGNRLDYTVAGGTPTTYERNDLNQYTVTIDPDETFLYDDDGNLTQDGTCTYTWDGENRLVGIENAWRRAQYDYDYMGRRVRARVWSASGNQWILSRDVRFLYDQWNLAWEETIIPGSGTDVARYTWGLDLSGTLHGAGGVGGLLHGDSIDGANTVFYDGNGNVTELVQGTTLVAHFEYDPFGNMQMVMGSPYVPFAFSTKYWDVFVGMGDYYYGLRYYTPRLGKWEGRDPIGEIGGENLSAFVLNDPTRLVDPLGTSSGAGDNGQRTEWSGPCTWEGGWYTGRGKMYLSSHRYSSILTTVATCACEKDDTTMKCWRVTSHANPMSCGARVETERHLEVFRQGVRTWISEYSAANSASIPSGTGLNNLYPGQNPGPNNLSNPGTGVLIPVPTGPDGESEGPGGMPPPSSSLGVNFPIVNLLTPLLLPAPNFEVKFRIACWKHCLDKAGSQ